jgi:hypothetical protein
MNRITLLKSLTVPVASAIVLAACAPHMGTFAPISST